MESLKADRVKKMLEEVSESNSGILTTQNIEAKGVHRGSIKKYVEDGMLVRESKGIYYFADDCPDEYALLQKRSEKMIFSYGTALYLLGLSDRVPHVMHVTVPQGYNVSRIKRDNPNVAFHYVQKEKWHIGITKVQTWSGSMVSAYDKERCICDLILMKGEIDKQIYIQAIQDYFKGNNDLRRLVKYAQIFKIEGKIRDYIDILV